MPESDAWFIVIKLETGGNKEPSGDLGAGVGRFCFLVNLLSTQAELESVLQFQK